MHKYTHTIVYISVGGLNCTSVILKNVQKLSPKLDHWHMALRDLSNDSTRDTEVLSISLRAFIYPCN